MKKPSFMLAKWYMDCVSDSGEVFIGYAASLRWKGIALHYSSALHHRDKTTVRTSMQKSSPPDVAGSSIRWSSRRLGVAGAWNAIDPSVHHTLLQTDAGSIEWQCVQPRARAEVQIGEQRIHGLGYVEHIAISIPPWQLPIDELRWGRHGSATDGVVWIDWRGAHPLTLVYHNGTIVDNAIVADDGVSFGAGSFVLSFDDSSVIREGRLVNTALSAIPGIDKLLPAKALKMEEYKWRSRSTIKQPEGNTSAGWSIHEIVRFV